MIRIGIVGCGRILAAHLQGYRLLREAGIDDFQITALCARKEADALGYVKPDGRFPQRKPVSDIPGDPLAVGPEYLSDFQPEVEDVAIYTDYEKMIAEGPIDAVNDFTIHSLHHKIALLSFEHGKHVMSQKPLAVSMEGARRMCDAAEKSGLTFGVFENFRYRRDFRQYRWAFSEDGPAGKLQMAMIGNIASWWAPDLVVAETPWRHVLDEAGGMALDLAPHFFNLLRAVGGEIKSVTAQAKVVEPVRYIIRDGQKTDPIDCNADDTFYSSFEYESGATGTLFASWAGHGTNTVLGNGAVFYGTKGRVSGDETHLDGESEPRSLEAVFEEQAPEELKTAWAPHGVTDDFALAQLDWIEAIKRGGQPETSGREGLLDLACSFGIVESSHAGRKVTVEEITNGSLRDYQQPIDEKFGLL